MTRLGFVLLLSALTCRPALSQTIDGSPDAEIRINAADPGIAISNQLWGLFFEEINFAGDGGIYAELVRHREFEGRQALEGWSSTADSAVGRIEVDAAQKLNDLRRQSLRVEVETVAENGSFAVVNSGYWGVPVRSGDEYSFSLFAKADGPFSGAKLLVSLRNAALDVVYAEAELPATSTEWRQLRCTLTPNADDVDGRLVISTDRAGTFWLDVVSLFPPTWMNQPNGLRADLIELLADLKPAFFRFPGGCYAEGRTLEDAFLFKETIGPVEQRRGRPGFWGYWSSDGLGYYEYLRLSEDLGADPIFCINPGGNNGVSQIVPMDQMEPWLQTAVDAVEFAIGPADSPYGAQRAAMGHSEPFGFDTFYLQIGNETEFRYDDYVERFQAYRDRVKSTYPGENVQIIADSWGLKSRQSVDAFAIDFHQYMSWGQAIADRDRFADAPRGAPYVFKGEYATRAGSGILQALSEAVYMMGLEENSDEVVFASYAPLLGNVNQCQWRPDLIYYDNHRAMGTISYYVQQMFAHHQGDQMLPLQIEQRSSEEASEAEQISGSIGLGTWTTQAEYKDVRVVVDGETVYQSDFSDPSSLDQWTVQSGRWRAEDGVLRQSSRSRDCRVWLKDRQWSKYELHLKARKISGAEGFLVLFHVQGADEYVWANLGGWGNNQHAFERAESGGKVPSPNVIGSIETDHWYEIVLQVDNSKVACRLDGVELLAFDLADLNMAPDVDLFASACTDDASGEVLVRLVNIAEDSQRVRLQIDGVDGLESDGTAVMLSAENREASQDLDDPLRYSPQRSALTGVSTDFEYEAPPCSFTILRLKQKSD